MNRSRRMSSTSETYLTWPREVEPSGEINLIKS
jgi:hypothetical protein